MRAPRHLLSLVLPLGLALVVAAAGVLTAPPAPARAAIAPTADISLYPPGVTGGTFDQERRLYQPDLAACSEKRPANQFISYPSYAQTAEQICGMWGLQNAAATAYEAMHGFEPGDPVQVSDLYAQAGIVQTLLQQISYAVAKRLPDVTPAQRAAYQWFLAIQRTYQRTAAAEAQREYRRWEAQQCGYRPPGTGIFGYNPTRQPICNPDGDPGLVGLFTSVAPPSYANFVQYGRYDAERILGIAVQPGDRIDRTLIDNGIVAGTGAVAAVIAGGAPFVAATLPASAGALGSFLKLVQPHSRAIHNSLVRAGQSVTKAVQGAVKAGRVVLGSQRVLQQVRAATDVVKAGSRSLSGPMTIVTVAITIAVMRGISVFTAAAIPRQLADDVAAAEAPDPDAYVFGLLTAEGGADAPVVYATYRSQLRFPEHVVGVPAPPEECADCVVYDEIPLSSENRPARIRMTALHPDGTPSGWSRIAEVATGINTWGMGAGNGAYGVPFVDVGIAGGRVWTKQGASSPPTDESEAGLRGWLPSGELRYFDPSGQPMIAYLNGEQFLTQTSPGSVSAGGLDAGNDCATPGQCTASSSIVVMGGGGTPELRNEITNGTFFGMECTANSPGTHDCLTDTLSPNGRLVPATGTRVATSGGEVLEQRGTSRLYRLTIVPNRGTTPEVWVTNEHNALATSSTTGLPPGGGLVAGETVTFSAPEISPAGYDTTYTWHVQSVCPDDADHPARTIQGVLVCSDDPSYGAGQLAANQQDLTSCRATVGVCRPDAVFGVEWTPDPAFGGGPIRTLVGRSVEWTWPAPGTYNLRLVTRDQYGVTRSSDRLVVVAAATAPRSVLAYAAAADDPQPRSLAPSVIGPVRNGSALTVTGCVESPTTRGATTYATPEVSVDWGDGDGAEVVTAVRGAGAGCTTPWRWQASHTYAVDTHGQPFVQVPITVTTRDVTVPRTDPADLPGGTPSSSSVTLYANVHAATAPPVFVGGTTATYDLTAGERALVAGSVTSVPDATLSLAPAGGVTHQGATCTPGLPTGVGFSATADRFELSGIPRVDAGGCYAVTLTATNPHGSAEQRAVLAVAQEPAITSAASVGWDTAGSGHAFTVRTSGFPAPRLSVGAVLCTTGCGSSLPGAVTLTDHGDGTATLAASGLTDADTGVYELTLEATSPSGTARQTFTLTIDGPPVFTGPASTGFTTGRAGTFPVGVSSVSPVTLTCRVDGSDDRCRSGDGSRPYVAADLAAGTGLSLVGTAISGIPARAGRYPVTLTATNAVGSTTQDLTILVSASGGATLTLDRESPNLTSYSSGPIPAGEATFVLGEPGRVTLCSNVPGDTVSTETVVDGESVATPLPAGLSITRTANTRCGDGDQQLELAGTPTAPAPDTTGATAYRLVDDARGLALLTLRLLGAPTFSSPAALDLRAGQPASFTASIGTLRYANRAYTTGCVTGATGLPEGLSFVSGPGGTGIISGTPVAGGRSTVTLSGTDCADRSTTQELVIDVAEAPVITAEEIAGFRVGVGGSTTVGTVPTGHPRPALQVSGLPDGARFTDHGDGTGTLTVAPEMPATSTAVLLQITATSSAGTDTRPMRLAVGSAPRAVSPASRAAVAVPRGLRASYTVTTSAVPAAALTADGLPDGMSFTDHGDGTGTIAGTPGTAGSRDVVVTARNGIGDPATSTLQIVVTDPASYAGTTTVASCSDPADQDEHLFVAASEGRWTICGAGAPAPAITLGSVSCGAEPAALSPGLALTDHGDGSASIAGTAAIGSGAACPDGYTVEVVLANAGGSVATELTLRVREVLALASPGRTEPFVPGAPNASVISAAGSPLPMVTLDESSSLPGWLTLTDQGNGTAVLAGTPPASAAGDEVHLRVRVTNGQAAALVEEITLPVADLGLAAAAPPQARLGTPYSYRFEAPDGVEVGLAEGGALPRGLRLSSTGVLSGTPQELGRFPVPLTLTRGADTVTTGAIELHVTAGHGALTIAQFRTLDPRDWFVQVVNTTAGPIDLTGWHVALPTPGEEEPVEVPLGTAVLRPGGTAMVATPLSTMGSRLGAASLGGGELGVPSGFRIVAPNGAVTDRAGTTGADAGLVEGTGVSYPSALRPEHLRYAFVRRGFAAGSPVDTDDNAADFVLARVAGSTDPRITARVTADRPRRAGWYRTPVRIAFACTASGDPLAAACPPPVVLRAEGRAQTVTRTVTALDGGRGTVSVTVKIDRSGPRVRLAGVGSGGTGAGRPPRVRCVATDALSGVARCRVTRVERGSKVRYTAVAVDRAGNTTRRTVVVRLRR